MGANHFAGAHLRGGDRRIHHILRRGARPKEAPQLCERPLRQGERAVCVQLFHQLLNSRTFAPV